MKQIKCELCESVSIVKDGEFYICQYCGCKYTLEAAQKLFIEVEVVGMDTADSLFEKAKTFEKLNEWTMAEKTYSEMQSRFPMDYRGWFGTIVPLGTDVSISCKKMIRCGACKKISYGDNLDAQGRKCSCGADYFLYGYKDVVPQAKLIKIRENMLSNALAVANEVQRKEIEALVESVNNKNEKTKEKVEIELSNLQKKWEQAYKWGVKNGNFLNQFTNAALAERFEMNCKPSEVASKLTGQKGASEIRIEFAYEDVIKGRYSVYSNGRTIKNIFTYKIMEKSQNIEGDIRESMNGFEKKLFCRQGIFNKKYSYEKDAHKDK